MKTLIFSDTHLTDKFDKELFDYIAKLVKNADQVVINGDFWDAYITDFDNFCTSEWQKLFPLLKKKKTVYIFGNHDEQKYMDERMNLFSNVQKHVHKIKLKDKYIKIQHGHLISPAEDVHYLFSNANLIRPFYRMFVFFQKRYSRFHSLVNLVYQERKDTHQLNDFISHVKGLNDKKAVHIFGHCHIKYEDKKLRVYSCSFLSEAEFSYITIKDGKIKLNYAKNLQRKN